MFATVTFHMTALFHVNRKKAIEMWSIARIEHTNIVTVYHCLAQATWDG
jgi:hypothetical protein